MRARAALATEAAGDGHGTRVSTLRSEAPLMLRLTHAKGPEPWVDRGADVARVCLASGAAGPLGGDEFRLTVDVGPATSLVLREVSATLLLPGSRGELSHLLITVRVGAGATLIWLPEPVIAARGCRHLTDVRVELAEGARLVLREELLLGRHGEQPGTVEQRLRVRRCGRPLLHQRLAVGPGVPGWDGAAVTAGRRALGTLLVVDPAWTTGAPGATVLGDEAAIMPLAGPAALVSTVAADALALRHYLDRGLAALTPAAAALVA